MKTGSVVWGERLLEALSEVLSRALRTAGERIALAMRAAGVRQRAVRMRSSACAAAAMRHATALAAEVLRFGGAPPLAPEPRPRSGNRLARATGLFPGYRRHLKMANHPGLLRLEEVLREIIQDLRVCSRTREGMFRLIRIS